MCPSLCLCLYPSLCVWSVVCGSYLAAHKATFCGAKQQACLACGASVPLRSLTKHAHECPGQASAAGQGKGARKGAPAVVVPPYLDAPSPLPSAGGDGVSTPSPNVSVRKGGKKAGKGKEGTPTNSATPTNASTPTSAGTPSPSKASQRRKHVPLPAVAPDAVPPQAAEAPFPFPAHTRSAGAPVPSPLSSAPALPSVRGAHAGGVPHCESARSATESERQGFADLPAGEGEAKPAPTSKPDHASSLAAFTNEDDTWGGGDGGGGMGGGGGGEVGDGQEDLLDLVMGRGEALPHHASTSPPPTAVPDALTAAMTGGASPHGPSSGKGADAHRGEGGRLVRVVDASGDRIRRTGLRGAGEAVGEGKKFTVVTHTVVAKN